MTLRDRWVARDPPRRPALHPPQAFRLLIPVPS